MTDKSANSGQGVDTFAVCTNCSRLSNNLHTCDKCGSALPSDTTLCYGSESDPKRMRLDSSVPSTIITNGTLSKPSSPATNGDASTIALQSSTSPSVMPQQMYVNIHNPMLSRLAPVIPNGTTSSSNASTVAGTNPTEQGAGTSALLSGGVSLTSTSGNQQMGAATNLVLQLASVNQNNGGAVSSISGQSTAVVNGTHGNTTLPSAVSAVMSQLVRGANNGVSGELLTVETPREVFFAAHQIRIGEKKFKPLSPINFKQDGILFTLKDYNFAPVLLNTRAIVQCRACLTQQFPIIFLHLEQSCMKQIRTIFKMADSQFSDKASKLIRRCISIYLNMSPVTGGVTQLQLTGLRQLLSTMLASTRGGFREITEEEAIDELLDTTGSDGTTTAVAELANNARLPGNPQTNVTFSNVMTVASLVGAQQMSRPIPAVLNNTSRPQQQQQLMQQLPSSLPTAGVAPNVQALRMNVGPVGQQFTATTLGVPAIGGAAAAVPQMQIPASASLAPMAGAQTLIIPSNPRQWQAMQKNLVSGGVYHVQTTDGTKKYCLWNGSNLVPCMVQNTEIRLECHAVRIGSFTSTPNGPLKVQADNTCTITFSLKDIVPSITLQEQDMKKVMICFDPVPVLVIHLNGSGAEALRSRCRINDNRDPGFNINTTSEKRRHFIFWLKALTTDQRDALMQISVKSGHSALPNGKLCSEMKTPEARTLFVNILRSIRNEGPTQGQYDRLPLDTIVQRVMTNDVGNLDDDEDDVVMTSEEVGIKCPYTQQVMKEPYRNKICGHNYERAAILEFISRRKPGTAKCPYAGCGNQTPLAPSHLEDNVTLKKLIEQQLRQ